MGRSGESAGKRRVTALRNERKAAKAGRRQQRQDSNATAEHDDAETMAKFHELNELRSVGAIPESDYERERADIYRALGLEDPFASDEPPAAPTPDQEPG
jgi:hypothetical protein